LSSALSPLILSSFSSAHHLSPLTVKSLMKKRLKVLMRSWNKIMIWVSDRQRPFFFSSADYPLVSKLITKLTTVFGVSGEEFKEKIIPHAVDYFTGKALEYGDYDEGDDDFEDDFYDDEDDDDEDDDDEDEDDDDDDETVS
jgi:hypothetical protein